MRFPGPPGIITPAVPPLPVEIGKGPPALRRQLTSHKYETARQVAETLARLGRAREGLSLAVAEYFGLPSAEKKATNGDDHGSRCLFYVTLGQADESDILQACGSAQGDELIARRPLPSHGRCIICQRRNGTAGADTQARLTGWECCGEAYCVPCPEEARRMERYGVPRWARLTRVCFCANIGDYV
jgi:hypothetical protein